MKETIQDLKNRRSVKEFKKEQITDEELITVLEAGMNAPSGGNRQSPIFIAVQNPEWIRQEHRKDLTCFTGRRRLFLFLLRKELEIR